MISGNRLQRFNIVNVLGMKPNCFSLDIVTSDVDRVVLSEYCLSSSDIRVDRMHVTLAMTHYAQLGLARFAISALSPD